MDFQKIPLDSVKPSPMNPRKTFDEEAVQELAANIEKQGLIQPITVRPRVCQIALGEEVTDGYEIVCGERRYRAFCQLKAKEDKLNVERVAAHRKKYDRFQSIPAMIREMTDEEAFEAMITENLQRQDVDPMEEAFAFGQLIKNGKTAEEVALKFGKSIRFVQDRCKLNSLIPELMLAVQEDKMSIAAAMIICKLEEEGQKKYHSQYSNNYQGLTKTTAESFVNGLFMNLSKSPWYQSDDQSDEEFEGGCDCKCSECQLNTANHGCLFWEMKSQDAGRCTNRTKFQSKLLAYMLKTVDAYAADLVPKGSPLTFGKVVIGAEPVSASYCSDAAKAVKQAFVAEIEHRGYETVNPSRAFDRKCWYKADDERTVNMLASGELYRVLDLDGYDMPTLTESFYYVKKGDTSTNSDESGRPMKVNELLRESRTIASERSYKVVAARKAIVGHGEFKDRTSLDNAEFIVAYSLMVKNNRELCLALGLGEYPSDEKISEYVASNLDKAPFILRAWVKKALDTGTQIITLNEATHIAEPYVERIGELWCPIEYHEAIAKAKEKREKAINKIANQLKKLGYDLEGNKLPEKPADTTPKIAQIKEQYEAMKKQHSDAIIIFRLGDEYGCIEQDASIAAITLGLKLQSKGNTDFVKFPKSDLDAHVPTLIKAGYRVAICEQLEPSGN
jgi:ParB-like chromosome segregation protein Spo0J